MHFNLKTHFNSLRVNAINACTVLEFLLEIKTKLRYEKPCIFVFVKPSHISKTSSGNMMFRVEPNYRQKTRKKTIGMKIHFGQKKITSMQASLLKSFIPCSTTTGTPQRSPLDSSEVQPTHA